MGFASTWIDETRSLYATRNEEDIWIAVTAVAFDDARQGCLYRGGHADGIQNCTIIAQPRPPPPPFSSHSSFFKSILKSVYFH